MKKKLGLCLLGLGLSVALPALASGGADGRLVQAVRDGDHAVLKRLLAAHVNVNAPLPDKTKWGRCGWASSPQ